jgi:excinuclease ABC subunit C
MGNPTKSSDSKKTGDSGRSADPDLLVPSSPEAKTPLAERLKLLPILPGVYLMKDAKGEVIYVGKAKSLRSRVRTYFAGGDGRYNIKYLITKIVDVETVVTHDERQALILENDLIKKYRPRYNIKLKDDKAHFLVRIDLNQKWPRIELVRKDWGDHAKYLGPFPHGYELKTVLEVIRNTLPLRTCSDRVIINRVRPCLEYQLKRCAGPCCLPVSESDYRGWIENAIDLLEGKNKDIVGELENAMIRASEALRFEDAARIRDQIQTLNKSAAEMAPIAFGSKDIVGIHRDEENIEISLLQVRRGRLMNAKTFGFEHIELADDEVLSSFLSRYYDGDQEFPEQIVIPFALEDMDVREDLYSDARGEKVEILVPERGEKYKLLLLAQENAKENFIARFSSVEGDSASKGLKDELGLEQIPRTIECADISHFQGGSTVASVVHFRDSKPDKTRYRHFNLTSQEGKPDDFASMLEVVTRQLSRSAEENTLPDLLIIDGGKAQLSKAIEARNKLGLSQPVLIGLAKRRTVRMPYFGTHKKSIYKPERIYIEGKESPVVLRETSKALHLLERLRDEAHRFAITFHRSTRTNRTFKSILETIPGLGPERRKKLLKEFGSVARLREATPQEMADRTGLSLNFCKRVCKKLGESDLEG